MLRKWLTGTSVVIGLAVAPTLAVSRAPDLPPTPMQQPASPDVEFLQQAAKGAESEMALAALAQKQAADPRVKDLGDVLKRDHEAARTEIQKLAKPKNAELTAMTVGQLAVYNRLEKMTGAEFDRAWLQAIIELHRDTRGVYSRATRSADAEIKAFATLQATMLEDHLKRAKALADQIK